MDNTIWFKGSSKLNCSIQKIKNSLKDYGKHFIGVNSLMPGLIKLELLKQGKDFVIIKTNEGFMKRTNIIKSIEFDKVEIEFDEEYQTKMVTTKSHFKHSFIDSGEGIKHSLVLTNVKASGLLGFFYKTFGKSHIGKAILKSNKNFFET